MKNTVLILVLCLTYLPFFSQDAFNTDKGYAIEGYDVVSYFEGIAQKGDKKFQASYQGISFLFVSEAHKNAFAEAPERYLPQYGGYCAYAMAKNGEKVSINPKSFLVTNGSLYLFYHRWGVNTLKKWEKEGPEMLKEKADRHWESLQKQ